jgi:hypothetical protein
MSGDTLTYDLSQSTEGSAQVFVKKDWLNILDNQNGNYSGNQSVCDTSQIANSNKYVNYREGYFAVPMVLTASNANVNVAIPLVAPATTATSVDLAFGLKNWWGQIIHSFTLDVAGTTIIQQTPLINLWNNFRLMTTLSWQDVYTSGAEMGFYPDNPLAWGFSGGASGGASTDGVGVCNNRNRLNIPQVQDVFNPYETGNTGFLKRQQYIAYDPDAVAGSLVGGSAYSAFLTGANALAQYKSYIAVKQNAGATTQAGIQYAIMATIKLRHIHSFFQNIPLMKGLFMKMTMNLNQSSVSVLTPAGKTGETYGEATFENVISVNNALGGVSPIMIASKTEVAGGLGNGGGGGIVWKNDAGGAVAQTLNVSLAVGSRALISSQSSFQSGLAPSIQLYIPAYTFNPVYETAYLSSPVKKVVYTDVYQYQVPLVQAGKSFNQLITNGIANIKSVLVIPLLTSSSNNGLDPLLTPFDDCGSSTAPLGLLTNFNVVVAGQNMIYNSQRYSYEAFLNQLQGCNAVNANLTDGLTSSLIDKLSFEMKNTYYYVDCSRMLPVEESVPKSVSIIGQNSSAKDLQFIVFVEYGVQVNLDVLSGARV